MTRPPAPVFTSPEIAALHAQVQAQTDLADSEEFRSGANSKSPGEVALLFFGKDWQVFADEPVAIPEEYRSGADTLTYNTVLVSNGHLWATTSICTHEARGMNSKPFNWGRCTGRQRSNQMAAALRARTVYGTSAGDLLARLAHVVENSVFGSDPTNWIRAAHVLIEQGTATERENMDAALFVAGLGSPRFVDLLTAAAPV